MEYTINRLVSINKNDSLDEALKAKTPDWELRIVFTGYKKRKCILDPITQIGKNNRVFLNEVYTNRSILRKEIVKALKRNGFKDKGQEIISTEINNLNLDLSTTTEKEISTKLKKEKYIIEIKKDPFSEDCGGCYDLNVDLVISELKNTICYAFSEKGEKNYPGLKSSIQVFPVRNNKVINQRFLEKIKNKFEIINENNLEDILNTVYIEILNEKLEVKVGNLKRLRNTVILKNTNTSISIDQIFKSCLTCTKSDFRILKIISKSPKNRSKKHYFYFVLDKESTNDSVLESINSILKVYLSTSACSLQLLQKNEKEKFEFLAGTSCIVETDNTKKTVEDLRENIGELLDFAGIKSNLEKKYKVNIKELESEKKIIINL